MLLYLDVLIYHLWMASLSFFNCCQVLRVLNNGMNIGRSLKPSQTWALWLGVFIAIKSRVKHQTFKIGWRDWHHWHHLCIFIGCSKKSGAPKWVEFHGIPHIARIGRIRPIISFSSFLIQLGITQMGPPWSRWYSAKLVSKSISGNLGSHLSGHTFFSTRPLRSHSVGCPKKIPSVDFVASVSLVDAGLRMCQPLLGRESPNSDALTFLNPECW